MASDVEAYGRALMPVLTRVRRDISAVKGEIGSYWTDEPINRETMRRHLNGGPARGACPIKEGESVTMLAMFDLDSHKGETSFIAMQAITDKLMDELYDYGCNGVPILSSGGNGVHVYVLWEQPQDAYSVRLRMREILANIGFKDGAKGVAKKQIEVFPKQDEVGPGEFGNQFILPLAGKSVPLDPDTLAKLTKADIVNVEWLMSSPVPVVMRPVREPGTVVAGAEPIERVVEALAAIPNNEEIDYDAWRNIVFAVHEATGGSEEGYEAVSDWSAQSPVHNEKYMRNRVWAHIKAADSRSDGGITRASLYRKAAEHGWVKRASADGFEELDVEVGPARAVVAPSAQPSTVSDVAVVSDAPTVVSSKSAVSNAVSDVTMAFIRDQKTGAIKPTVPNIMKVMRRPDLLLMDIAFDTFDEQIKWRVPGEVDAWHLFTDEHYMDIREHLETPGSAINNSFEPLGRELVRDAVFKRARENQFDSAKDWLNPLVWDGVPRVELYFIEYFGLDDTPYHRAVAMYLWSACAGRVLQPGVKADMVPVFVGDQGIRKSTAIEIMVPHEDFFVEISFHEKDDDLSRKMRGKMIGEIGELRGLGTKDQDSIKAMITRKRESWVPKFREFETKFHRRCILIASTNEGQFLADTTGNRRWLPLCIFQQIDTEGIEAARNQLWAEGAEIFRQRGVLWRAAQELAVEEHARYEQTDSWIKVVQDWLDRPDFAEGSPDGAPVETIDAASELLSCVTTRDLLIGALRFEAKQIAKKDEMHMASILKKLNYTHRKITYRGKQQWLWVKSLEPKTAAAR